MPESQLYLDTIKKGRAAVEDLFEFREDEPTPTFLVPAYKIEHKALQNHTPRLNSVLAKYGIDFSIVEYVDAMPRANTREKAVYLNEFDTANDVVIANLDGKSRDQAAPEDKIFSWEILWRSYLNHFKRRYESRSQSYKLRVIAC